jgi:hypothetical protein
MAHAEEDLVYWVRHGKQGTAMPTFDDTLSDQEIRDVLSYIAAEQAATNGSANATTGPAACTVAPLAMADLEALAGRDATPPDVPVAASAEVSGATRDGIEGTMQQMLACTNATDTMRRLALFTDRYLASAFAAGIPDGFAESAAPGEHLPSDQWLTLGAVRDVTMLEDGRVMATVEILDPASHFHTTGAELEPASSGTIVAQLIFAEVDGAWLIDGLVVR